MKVAESQFSLNIFLRLSEKIERTVGDVHISSSGIELEQVLLYLPMQ